MRRNIINSNTEEDKKTLPSDIIKKYKMKSRKKCGFDPIIFRMVQHNNISRIKKFMIYSFVDYLPFKEVIELRNVCKLFNATILDKYKFLNDPNLLMYTETDFKEIKEQYNIKINDTINLKDAFSKQSQEILSDKFINGISPIRTFSKTQMFYHMINKKDYASLRYKIKTKQIKKPFGFEI